MDLIHYDKYRFDKIRKSIRQLAAEFDFETVHVIPVSATEGDNVTRKSKKMPWYTQKPLLKYLETIDVSQQEEEAGFAMPVQRVSRPDHTFRGFAGQIESGQVALGDEISVLPSGEKAKVKRIYVTDKEADKAVKGQAVTICLDREMDVSRGCILQSGAGLKVGSMFTAALLWMDDSTLVAGKNYFLKLGTKMIPAVVMKIKYKIDVNEGDRLPTEALYKNEIAVCDISVADKIVFDEFTKNKALGGFILIDRITNMTSACGVVKHSLRRGNNVTRYEMDITRDVRSQQKNQKPLTLWFTGLSGSGKSTLANEVEKRLVTLGKHTMSLDGDNIRLGLNKNLGFKEADRIENIRRIAEVSKLMNDAGLIVLTSFISPFARDRMNAKEIIGDSFVEVYVSTPLEECEKRDVKGLYKKVRAGEIPNFTGISSPYEAPRQPDIEINTAEYDLDTCVDKIMEVLEKYL